MLVLYLIYYLTKTDNDISTEDFIDWNDWQDVLDLVIVVLSVIGFSIYAYKKEDIVYGFPMVIIFIPVITHYLWHHSDKIPNSHINY